MAHLSDDEALPLIAPITIPPASSSTPPQVDAMPTPTNTTTRYHALDNLRTFFTALVILHHTAIVYGGAGNWWLRSQCVPPESMTLVTFNAVDQTFFMALFFFLSGYFTRRQMGMRGKGNWTLIRTRLLRILLPAIVYTLLVEPSLAVMMWVWGRGATGHPPATVASICVSYWSRLNGIKGPVWYLALVMVFDTFAVLLPSPMSAGWSQDEQQHLYHRIRRIWSPLAWLTTILSSFAIRLIYPVSRIWPPLNLQPGYLPQYILAYSAGHISFIFDDLFTLSPFIRHPAKHTSHSSPYTTTTPTSPTPSTRGFHCKVLRSLSILLLTLSLTTLLQCYFLHLTIPQISSLSRGGLNIPALVYAVWNELGFMLLGFSILALFTARYDQPWTLRVPFTHTTKRRQDEFGKIQLRGLPAAPTHQPRR